MLEYIKNRIKNRQWFKDLVQSKLTPETTYAKTEERTLECEFYFYIKESLLVYKAHDDVTPCEIDESSGRCKICGI